MKHAYLYHRVVREGILIPQKNMKKVLNSNIEAGSRESNEPRLLGSIVSEMLHGDSPLAVGYRQYIASLENGEDEPKQLFKKLFPDTHLCVDLKLITHQQGRMPVGAYLDGFITRSGEDKFIFTEKEHLKKVKAVQRNPVIFAGSCVNVHVLADGTKRLDFNRPRFCSESTFRDFCLAAAQELLTIARLLGEEDAEV